MISLANEKTKFAALNKLRPSRMLEVDSNFPDKKIKHETSFSQMQLIFDSWKGVKKSEETEKTLTCFFLSKT